ncbi:MAG: extracellular solute-binding protein, partial [Pseudomonadota bacterium]|nr:extracellular solute-binding protein [Pseudomonadota bacterium]
HKESHSLRNLYVFPFIEVSELLRLNLQVIKEKISRILEKIIMCWGAIGTRFLFIGLCLTGAAFPSDLSSQELNIYSHRQPFLINPFIRAFEKESGIKSNIVFSSKGLAQRLLAEGERSPADIVLTVDISRLNVYADKNLLATVESNILTNNIPKYLRDPNGRGFGLSKRARVVAVSKQHVDSSQIRRIEDLAHPSWRGRICSRPGSHVYNRALLASLIAANGAKSAEQWASGLVANLAQRPQGNDRAQVKAIYQGVCDIAIINSYYFGKLRNSNILAQRKWADGVQIIFTNQQDRGNHINISGGGVAKHSKNKMTAIKFLEFLSGEIAQKLYAEVNYEFPGNPTVEYSDELSSWGSFIEDKLPIGVIAELAPEAQKIIDRVGW